MFFSTVSVGGMPGAVFLMNLADQLGLAVTSGWGISLAGGGPFGHLAGQLGLVVTPVRSTSRPVAAFWAWSPLFWSISWPVVAFWESCRPVGPGGHIFWSISRPVGAIWAICRKIGPNGHFVF